jgi:hypothetical protein
MASSNPGNQGNQQNQGRQDGPSERGFAGMEPERQREIAAEGGRAAHASGNAHEFTSREAREASSQSHKGQSARSGGSSGSPSGSGGTRGGSREQHAEAGRQSHKNS